jgi:hypothetical protein
MCDGRLAGIHPHYISFSRDVKGGRQKGPPIMRRPGWDQESRKEPNDPRWKRKHRATVGQGSSLSWSPHGRLFWMPRARPLIMSRPGWDQESRKEPNDPRWKRKHRATVGQGSSLSWSPEESWSPHGRLFWMPRARPLIMSRPGWDQESRKEPNDPRWKRKHRATVGQGSSLSWPPGGSWPHHDRWLLKPPLTRGTSSSSR